MDLFRNITILSLEQATVLPYLTYRLAIDGCRVIRVEHPISSPQISCPGITANLA
jgi:hypothetical protein